MGETPNLTPQLNAALPLHWVTVWGQFIKAHEKLLIIILASGLLYRFGQGIENVILRHDQTAAQTAASKVQSDEAANKILEDQLAQLKADTANQNAKLNNEIVTALTSLKNQKARDAQSTPSQIDDRWQALLPLKPGAVTQLNSTTTAITNEAANQTVQALEEIPVLEKQAETLKSELTNDESLIKGQDETITGLTQQISDEKKSHLADVKLEKAKARHSFWKGLKIGVVVGAIGVEAIRVWAGHP